jgi:hypothetical protein
LLEKHLPAVLLNVYRNPEWETKIVIVLSPCAKYEHGETRYATTDRDI